jgi:hypothetical protein
VAQAFLKDQITIGHALLIAKLPASQQQTVPPAARQCQRSSANWTTLYTRSYRAEQQNMFKARVSGITVSQ